MAAVLPDRSNVKRRSFTGCLMCRTRKVKCDLQRPSCGVCERLSLECPGYTVQLSWLPPWNPSIPDDDQDIFAMQNDNRSLDRRHLSAVLTDAERFQSSSYLRRQISDGSFKTSVAGLLDNLERQVSGNSIRQRVDSDQQVQVGPFSVFSINSLQPVTTEKSTDSAMGLIDAFTSASVPEQVNNTEVPPQVGQSGDVTSNPSEDRGTYSHNTVVEYLPPNRTNIYPYTPRSHDGTPEAQDSSPNLLHHVDMLLSNTGVPETFMTATLGSPDLHLDHRVLNLSFTQIVSPGEAVPLTWDSDEFLDILGDVHEHPDTQSHLGEINPRHTSLEVDASFGAERTQDEETLPQGSLNSMHPQPSPLTSAQQNVSRWPLTGILPLRTLSPYLPADVGFLLSHFSCYVIDSFAMVPVEKAPWTTLHLQSAMTAYGELDVLGRSSLPRVSLLYSLLAISSYHLSTLHTATCSRIDPGDGSEASAGSTHFATHWDTQGHKYRNIARVALHKALNITQNSSADSLEIKELFMALTTLIITGIVSGDMWDSRLYIIYGDQILRQKFGHKQSWPDDIMQLRCIFSFSTVVERTSFAHTKSGYITNLETHAVFLSELQLVKNMSEDVSSWSLQTSICTGPMGGELASPTHHDDLFESLYGIPGSLLNLIQRVDDLVGRLRSLEVFQCLVTVDGPSPDALKDAVSLGHEIYTWSGSIAHGQVRRSIDANARAHISKNGVTTDNIRDAPYTIKLSLTNAVYYATLVYFFRRVHNTSPRILQHYVEAAISSLEAHNEIKTRFYPLRTFGGMVWPAFIVACEAIDEGLRSRAIQCLRQIVIAGFRNGYAAELVVRELWQRRDTGDLDVSWQDIIRTNNVCIVLT